jgi:DNA-directed RNA polymerase specialized sigma24 family protein
MLVRRAAGHGADPQNIAAEVVARALSQPDVAAAVRYWYGEEPEAPVPSWSKERLSAWIWTTFRYVVLEHHRIARRETGEARIVLDEPPKLETRRALEECMERLTEDKRTAVLMRIDGYSYEDIAGVLGCPVNTVASHLRRAYEALAKCMSPKGRR